MIDVAHPFTLRGVRLSKLAASMLAIASLGNSGQAGPVPTFLPTGLKITPTAAPGSDYEALNPKLPDFPNFIASGALSSVKSPDGKTLLVLVSGYNALSKKTGTTTTAVTNEYIFVFDITAGKPVEKQVIEPAHAH